MGERGHLQVDTVGNASGFNAMLQNIKQNAKHAAGEINAEMSKSWGGVGKGFVAGVGGLLSVEGARMAFDAAKESLNRFLERAKGIGDLAEQMDYSTDAVQRWKKATDGLGLSFSGLQTVLESIRSKRQEALVDPKAAQAFQDLGISRDVVRDTKNIDESEFARRVLEAGTGSEESRAALGNIVGKRGVKYSAAARDYLGASADITPGDIEAAKGAEDLGRKLKGVENRTWSAILGHIIKNPIQSLGGALAPNALKPLFGGSLGGQLTGAVIRRNTGGAFGSLLERLGLKDAAPIEYQKATTATASGPDEAEEKRAEKTRERLQHQADTEERIENAKRQNMTTAEKRLSRENQLARIDKKIGDERAIQAPKYLQQKGREEELLDWQTKHQDRIADLEIQRQGIIGDLKEKPMSMATDSLTKSGLVTAGGLNFATDSGQRVQQEQLRQLVELNRKISAHNPWKL